MDTKMTHWHITAFSELTGVSVRTLHYYDHLGLLKPRVEPENGYRLYSKADLLKLQQILALKYFGFKLKRIGQPLLECEDPVDVLHLQETLLDQQISTLQNTKHCLTKVLSEYANNKSIDW